MKIKRTDRKSRMKTQRLCGVALVVLGVLSAILLEGDITAALLVVPLGFYALFTRNDILW